MGDPRKEERAFRVAVIDMQPITPAVGGGRLRLLGLYHALGAGFDTNYVGTYDWPGERYRDTRLSDSLREIDVPLSEQHFRCDGRWKNFAGGTTIIDTAFPLLGRLSENFLSQAKRSMAHAEVVVFSHPWVYPLLRSSLDRRRQLLVYDAHNVESLLRFEILGNSPFKREIAKNAAMAEIFLAREADAVLVCSDEDGAFFQDKYLVSKDRLFVVPNGVFVRAIPSAGLDRKKAAKRSIGIGAEPAVLFLGSNYGPNVEAAEFICKELATTLPRTTFIICGGVGEARELKGRLPGNVRLTGKVSDEEKLICLHAADMAVNPMFSGSGTNIKMFDFMAAGLPVITTKTGARGICDKTERGIFLCRPADFVSAIAHLSKGAELRQELGQENREWAVREYAWESLSPRVGDILRRALQCRTQRDDGPAEGGALRRPVPITGARRGFERQAQRVHRVAILSTFGIRCGIAEYASYFAQGLLDNGVAITIFGNLMAGHEGSEVQIPSSLGGACIERSWRYDNRQWVHSEVDVPGVVRSLRAQSVEHLNVQYHPAFFPERMLCGLLRSVRDAGIGVSVTHHISSSATEELISQLAGLGATVLVHKLSESYRLRSHGVDRARFIPQGIRRLAATEQSGRPFGRGPTGRPTVGTFGFLRAHKGLIELVEAVGILKEIFPEIELHAQSALYPSRDSDVYLDDVRRKIAELGLEDSVFLDARFRDIDEVIAGLAQVDVVALPYSFSDEGSSAAAATTLAARRPLIATPAHIFDEIRSVVYTAEDNSPPVLAAAIGTVLSNASLRDYLIGRSTRLAEEREWKNVAGRFLRIVSGGTEEYEAESEEDSIPEVTRAPRGYAGAT
jgi:glycosyltransferase involved in cell wall biosynthesis